jgi:DNA-directed RNA polymerase subunit beta
MPVPPIRRTCRAYEASAHPAGEPGDLVAVQRDSYRLFLQHDVEPRLRADIGLQAAFKSVFPVENYQRSASLQFVDYEVGAPAHDVEACRRRSLTYAAPLQATFRLAIWDVDPDSGRRTVSNIREQKVPLGDIPLMTPGGSFIVQGTERVVVSQVHRSPGVFFDTQREGARGRQARCSARIIPARGAWIDFEFDTKGILHVRIDRRRKLHATVLLRALGFDTEAMLRRFHPCERFFRTAGGWRKETSVDQLAQQRASVDIVGAAGEVLVKRGERFLPPRVHKLRRAGMTRTERRVNAGSADWVEIATIPVSADELVGRVSVCDLVDPASGRILVAYNEALTSGDIARLAVVGIAEVEALFIDDAAARATLRPTLLADRVEGTDEAIIELYRRVRGSDPRTFEAAQAHLEALFSDPARYDLSRVGRHKLNQKLKLKTSHEQSTLTRDDLAAIIQRLLAVRNDEVPADDIDHLGNRRVRPVGELLEAALRNGLAKMARHLKVRMDDAEVTSLVPSDLVHQKALAEAVGEFFRTSLLAQFMDQTNPLSELTHKRRLSALGTGGLTRERAGFDVRDIHRTHYGRICPIETPEGPNVGLVGALASLARVNAFGFIESPYRRVSEGRVLDEAPRYLDATEDEFCSEGKPHVIAQADAALDARGRFVGERVPARRGGEPALVRPEEITLMDVSPRQLVSVAAALIPFLEHNDANRALMGANMQRQAVPVAHPEAPLVATGMEAVVARESGALVTSRRAGVVTAVDGGRVIVQAEAAPGAELGADVDIYRLTKFRPSNQGTCIGQRPVVKPGDKVDAGDLLADGPAIHHGELALGHNVIVAFMPWGGYNFEDSILLSERILHEDLYTTIHIEDFEVSARQGIHGDEEITRDLPNVGDEALRDLDATGIVRIGASVKPGDLLVGKLTPREEGQATPEEKLLRAIFGERSLPVIDSSLRVGPGIEGTVIDVRVLTAAGVERDARALEIEAEEARDILRDRDDKLRTYGASAHRALVRLLEGKRASVSVVHPETGAILIDAGQIFTDEALRAVPPGVYERIGVDDLATEDEVWRIADEIRAKIHAIHQDCEAALERSRSPARLPPKVVKTVRVRVAVKRKLSVGDKMAGRHGNKGVVSKVLPIEDMPYLEDGTPVDVVLNPLGVPSRMNVGQILETHLGWAARGMGQRIGALLDGWGRTVSDGHEQLRDLLRRGFDGSPTALAFLKGASPPELVTFAERYRRGVPVATPVFQSVDEGEIKRALERAGYDPDGQTLLFDGRTGEPFRERVTVGVMYMLKLHHLVDDKMHARSIGKYSLITQQPLGGRANHGGQRLGEMEVWALEAYGAAYALQELFTVKSDDVEGRAAMFRAITEGRNALVAGVPESFQVLVRELQALGLDVAFERKP